MKLFEETGCGWGQEIILIINLKTASRMPFKNEKPEKLVINFVWPNSPHDYVMLKSVLVTQ